MPAASRLIATATLILAGALGLSAQSSKRRDVFAESRLHPAIAYDTAEARDPIARLNRELEAGRASLTFNPDNGYLTSVLAALDVPVSSQGLVFSQTSLQADQINVKNPRAIYFNDTVSVGFVRGSTLLELAAQDPTLGVVFYTLEQKSDAMPRFRRDNNCLACHLSWDTLAVPGLMMQSVHPLADEYSYVNGYNTNHASPFPERWGGWFVTGTHGKLRHMGNVPVMPEDKGRLALADPRELASVEGLFDPKGYLSMQSDVTALLVLGHQVYMTNLITRVGWEARVADAAPSADATSRVKDAARDLVDYLFFVDEVPLSRPVKGTSGFAEQFSARGPRDRQGRSLHMLDLQTRLLKYPCSYMIYSDGFDALPPSAKTAIYARMWEILSGKETGKRYARLSAADRQAILGILRETKQDLPDYFRAS